MDSGEEIDIDQDKNNLEDEYGYEDDDLNEQDDANANQNQDEEEGGIAMGDEENDDAEQEEDDDQEEDEEEEVDDEEENQMEEEEERAPQKEMFDFNENDRRSRGRVNQGGNANNDDDDDDDDDDEEDRNRDEDEDDDDDDEGDFNENGEKRNSTPGSKLSEKKRNEFWKYRHKNKDEKWGGSSPTAQPSKTVISVEKVNKFEVSAGEPLAEKLAQVEKSPIASNLIGQTSQRTILSGNNINNNITASSSAAPQTSAITNAAAVPQQQFTSKFEDDNWMKFIVERAAKFNEDILQQKARISEIVKLNEKNRQMQVRQTPIESFTGTLFPAAVPVIVVTEDGSKYLTNYTPQYQKGTLDEFIKVNVQQEHVDLQGEYSHFGLKKQMPFPKKKLIKKKPTKKNTFGAELMQDYE